MPGLLCDDYREQRKSCCIFCEGDCKAWIHRKCLGMSILVYDRLSKCKDPYMFPHCTIFKQSNEITKLKNQVKDLTSELASMKTLEQKVIDLEQKLSSVNEPSSTSTSGSTAALLSLQPNHTNTADDHISNIVSSYISEEKEKAKRRLNLIVKNHHPKVELHDKKMTLIELLLLSRSMLRQLLI